MFIFVAALANQAQNDDYLPITGVTPDDVMAHVASVVATQGPHTRGVPEVEEKAIGPWLDDLNRRPFGPWERRWYTHGDWTLAVTLVRVSGA